VSRNGHTFKQWPQLAEELAHAIRTHSAILDGEICCLNPDGRTNFKQLLFRKEWPHFYAFDVLSIDGPDLTALPLRDRKRLYSANNADRGLMASRRQLFQSVLVVETVEYRFGDHTTAFSNSVTASRRRQLRGGTVGNSGPQVCVGPRPIVVRAHSRRTRRRWPSFSGITQSRHSRRIVPISRSQHAFVVAISTARTAESPFDAIE
jgi:ATP dependent DNA ligase domain